MSSTSVEVASRSMQAMATMVFPAPQGSVMTPEPLRAEPPAWNAAASYRW
jgi:hypothetical protein